MPQEVVMTCSELTPEGKQILQITLLPVFVQLLISDDVKEMLETAISCDKSLSLRRFFVRHL